MNQTPILLALLAFGFAAPISLAAAEPAKDHAADHAGMPCCNTVCAACDMKVDAAVKPIAFKPSADVKAKHADIDTAMVGFCSDACRATYEKDPAKFETKLVPMWQEWKNKPVKTKQN